MRTDGFLFPGLGLLRGPPMVTGLGQPPYHRLRIDVPSAPNPQCRLVPRGIAFGARLDNDAVGPDITCR
ncbi:hypothetical protein [Streptomyces sp. NPDC006668]|uniref:hypothetical protein n=1 Tax=Streptomyces sp. NPDC006668 TaxID=3156903 RepID=UPI0033FD8D55